MSIDAAIQRERAWQKVKYGDSKHDLMLWVRIMAKELAEAEHAIIKQTKEDALREILQVITVGVAALEQHGCSERGEVKGQFVVARHIMGISQPDYFTHYNAAKACWGPRDLAAEVGFATAVEIKREEGAGAFGEVLRIDIDKVLENPYP